MALVAACSADGRDGQAQGPGATNPETASDAGSAPVFAATQDAGAPSTKGECEKMDIVFVVDNSGSMGEEQANLASNFALVTGRLDAHGGGAGLDYRIAVTTTARTYDEKVFGLPLGGEKGDDGAFRGGCGMSRPWIERSDANRATELSCAANVGADGSSLEMPLDAMRLAVTDRIADGKNKGFLRDDALLAVVIMTDEDDCSHKSKDVSNECDPSDLRPIGTYLTVLDQLKNGRERWAVAVIAGDKSCTSSFGSAGEATRLKDFVQQTGKNAVFSSICQGDLVKPLESALDTFGEACKRFSVK